MYQNSEAKYIIISVIGPHAGQKEGQIFDRKINDIDINVSGKTYWLIRSGGAKPDMVQRVCSQANKEGENTLCIFIDPSSTGGSVPTKTSSSAQRVNPILS